MLHRVQKFSMLILLVMLFPVAAAGAAPELPGWWYSPDHPGTGASLEKQGDQIFLVVYDYRADNGRGVWYASKMSDNGGSYSGSIKEYEGWPLNGGDPAEGLKQAKSGTVTLTFNTDYTEAALSYSLDSHVERTLVPYLDSIAPGDHDPRNIHGWWIADGYPGMGFFIEAQAGTIYLGWYNYDDQGKARWWVAGGWMDKGGFPDGTTIYSASLKQFDSNEDLPSPGTFMLYVSDIFGATDIAVKFNGTIYDLVPYEFSDEDWDDGNDPGDNGNPGGDPVTPPSGDVFTNTLGQTFRLIPAGAFIMGSPATESGRWKDEGPQHTVTITQPYYMMTTEVTQGQWREIMGYNPSRFFDMGDDHPVEYVDYAYVRDYIAALNAREGTNKYRLPTEAEWEYACRAGTTTARYWGEYIGNTNANCDGCGNQWDNISTSPVASFSPNAWGLHDMLGNVREWCRDWYDPDYYTYSPQFDPECGDDFSETRVTRGGSWYNYSTNIRSAHRGMEDPDYRGDDVGFRLVYQAENTNADMRFLTITVAGDGTVKTQDGETACRSVCTKKFPVGSKVTLVASPDSDSKFVGWAGGACSGSGNCTFTLDNHTSLTATFVESNEGGGKPTGDIFTNSIGQEFKLIPSGTFTMGSPEQEEGHEQDESPRHTVTISKPFYMMTTEVTQSQWQAVMDYNPSWFNEAGDDYPVENVSLIYVQDFIDALNSLEGTTRYRLPTEAEWEYACRAGSSRARHWGEHIGTNNANCKDCGSKWDGIGTAPAASFEPNAWGLHDMLGNVQEWTVDWYDAEYYEESPRFDPVCNDDTNDYRVVRGGGWMNNASRVRSADRNGTNDSYSKSRDIGFRLIYVPEK